MKLLSFVLLLNVFIPSTALCQEQSPARNRFVSISGLFECPIYLINYSQNFNYGSGVLVSQNIARVKFSTGLYVSSKRYFMRYVNAGTLDHTDYRMLYYNIPVRFGVNILPVREENWKLFVSSGFEFNIPSQFSSLTYYNNNSPPTENDRPVSYGSGTSLLFELQLQRVLNNKLAFFLQGAFVYKVQLEDIEFTNSSPQWHPEYSNGRALLSLGAGVDFLLNKSAN
ncbi:MAG TPA: hypothetical protein VL651_17475 [Bacteroidia bacterium]|jgi:hypothetical protein|nr:hypothetical protein [Bacteroidia bacterium]